MRDQVAQVKNVKNLWDVAGELLERQKGVPGFGLLHGPTGAGKTTAVAFVAAELDAVVVRASATWTPAALLRTVLERLGLEMAGSASRMLEAATAQLVGKRRLILVDEADYLLGDNGRMAETLRDLHDASGAPVLLVGMSGIEKRLAGRAQLAGRISQWLEFGPADLDDARILADTICELPVADDLLAELHRRAGGSMRGLTVGLSRIENHAKKLGLSRIKLAEWGARPFVMPQRRAA